ncbi:agmatinase [Blochmannia endosymbiont of Polyrhachis (Hedomyrma) turneri]|uniref:agmatinase n=1 Tax=Blochmannia endosymbiont of Polyrhachis (Hedomyrma) turneri TaxID=1505596 RepID=UPI00061A53BD|nr:agmatinase [Blochmannia endosymbiont of Polyrhachis (Hedomyrma) turneri]AKC59824.1 Agmatinase [Blochmannia endosymbiont of Polyrhachis (Hedomyrma) turneri]
MNTLGYAPDFSLVSNAFGFLRFPLEYNPYTVDADWVITGVPFDMATTGRSGSRHGPSAIRQVSTHLAWEQFRWPWNFDLRKKLRIIDCGDLVFNFGDAQDMSNKLQMHAELLLSSGKRMLSFGGDHYITLPLLRAYAKHFNKLAIIHFDAHTDMHNSKSQYDHGSIFFHAVNEKLINPHHSIQIGIRTECNHANNFTIIDAEYIRRCDSNFLFEEVKKFLNSAGEVPFYLTFDIDCLDPSVAPGTGTPVVGGLHTNLALNLLRNLQFCNIVGMDVVEVAPAYDCSQITSLAAASIALDMLHVVVKD